MPRDKTLAPRRHYVPAAIVQHNRERRNRRFYRELARLFQSLSIPVRVRLVHGHSSHPVQGLDSMGHFRIHSAFTVSPASPPVPPMASDDEVLSEDPLPSSENSPVIPYPREMLSSFSAPLFTTTHELLQPER